MSLISNQDKVMLLFEEMGADTSKFVRQRKRKVIKSTELRKLNCLMRMVKLNSEANNINERFEMLGVDSINSYEAALNAELEIEKLSNAALPHYLINPFYFDENINFVNCTRIGELTIENSSIELKVSELVESEKHSKEEKGSLIEEAVKKWERATLADIDARLIENSQALQTMKNAKAHRKFSKVRTGVASLIFLLALFAILFYQGELLDLAKLPRLLVAAVFYFSFVTIMFDLIAARIFNRYHRWITIDAKFLKKLAVEVKKVITKKSLALRLKLTEGVSDKQLLSTSIVKYSIYRTYYDFFTYKDFVTQSKDFHKRCYKNLANIHFLMFIVNSLLAIAAVVVAIVL